MNMQCRPGVRVLHAPSLSQGWLGAEPAPHCSSATTISNPASPDRGNERQQLEAC